MKRSRIYASLQEALTEEEDKCWREQEEDRDPLQGTGKAAEALTTLHLLLHSADLNLEPEENGSPDRTTAAINWKLRTESHPTNPVSVLMAFPKDEAFAARSLSQLTHGRAWRQCHHSAPHNHCPLCLPSLRTHRPSPLNINQRLANHFTRSARSASSSGT